MKKFSFSGSSVAEVTEVAEVPSIERKQPSEVVWKFSEVTRKREKKQATSGHFRTTSETANPETATTSATSVTSEASKYRNAIINEREVFPEVVEVKIDEVVAELIPNLKPCPICRGHDFIHGYDGGYFCVICQPEVRPGVKVIAGEIDDTTFH